MEVRHHIIGIVQHDIDARIRQHHASNATDREEKHEANRPKHRRCQADAAAPHGGDPAENLDPGRHGDDQRRRREIRPRVDIEPDRKHMVRPDDEADKADRNHGIGHAEITEDRLAAEGRDHMADDAKRRQDHDVDLRVSEEPEQMLKQHRIAAAGRIVESRAEIAVGQQHRDRAAKHGHGEEQQERRDQHRPDEERHLMHRHAGRAHVEDGGDEVDRAEDRAGACKVQREDAHIDRHRRLAEGGERG